MAVSGVIRYGKFALPDPHAMPRVPLSHPCSCVSAVAETTPSDRTYTIAATIRAVEVGTGIVAEDSSQWLTASKWQDIVGVLQQYCALSCDLPDETGMVAPDINMPVDLLHILSDSEMEGAVRVEGTRVEVDGRLVDRHADPVSRPALRQSIRPAAPRPVPPSLTPSCGPG